MARNGSLQYSGGYCSDVSHYRDAILLRARSLAWSLPSPSQPSRGQKRKRVEEGEEEEEDQDGKGGGNPGS